MANTHDYSIANDTGSAVRSDLNTLFAQQQATNAGTSAPTSAVEGMLWEDTTNNILKQYDGSSWVEVIKRVGTGTAQALGTGDSPTFAGITDAGTVTAGTLASGVVFPAGHILQTKSSSITYTKNYTGSTSEFAIEQSSGVNWEPSITVASGNKILILIVASIKGNRSSDTDARSDFRLYQKIGSGSYNLLVPQMASIGGSDYGGSGIWLNFPHTTSFLSAPNSGDEIKFKMTTQCTTIGMALGVNDQPGDICHIILQEVQA